MDASSYFLPFELIALNFLSLLVRDRARREALKKELQRRNDWLKKGGEHLDSYASSEADRDEMFAMVIITIFKYFFFSY